MTVRIQAQVEGFVQGVGFRPFVYQLARRHQLGGTVLNTSSGATIEVEGPAEDVEAFFQDLPAQMPPLAQLVRLTTTSQSPRGETEFVITASQAQATRSALVSPDVAVCADCLAEMRDPRDRRYRYPFINCTNCGPRYTIIMDLPYDRDKTSMRVFPMCPDCAAEYHDPINRRFHAQPNACPVCGPRVWLTDAAGHPIDTPDPITAAATLLHQGLILAVKGLGGFHLAVDATNDAAVHRLRARKQREEKPLAVMAPDLAAASAVARITPAEEEVLLSRQRPIVLLTARADSPLASSVAPENKFIGVMLPYTPLHHLLLDGFTALVMTSGNLSEEPIATGNDEALARLGSIADYFLWHDREILRRADDSVVRLEANRLRQIRRSRGFAPAPLFLHQTLPSVLAVGGELKNTVCLLKDDRAFFGPHVGDLENQATLDSFVTTIDHLKNILDARPVAVAHDLHPEYLSTKWAQEEAGLPLIGVQHHHAHVVGVMAEHGLAGPVVGLACDGTGYGDDGQIWGGELLLAWPERYERRGHIAYLPMPGGAAAIREPWRMAASYLYHAYGPEAADLPLDLLARAEPEKLRLLWQVIAKRIASPLTSSLGRLFDAAAALIGLKDRVAFEGQAAMMLEMICPEGSFPPYDFDLEPADGQWVIAPRDIIRGLVADILAGRAAPTISGRFHATVVAALTTMAWGLCQETGVKTVVLSGGCFLNQSLARNLTSTLVERGARVYTQALIPVNDGGLALGQAYAAGAWLARKG